MLRGMFVLRCSKTRAQQIGRREMRHAAAHHGATSISGPIILKRKDNGFVRAPHPDRLRATNLALTYDVMPYFYFCVRPISSTMCPDDFNAAFLGRKTARLWSVLGIRCSLRTCRWYFLQFQNSLRPRSQCMSPKPGACGRLGPNFTLGNTRCGLPRRLS